MQQCQSATFNLCFQLLCFQQGAKLIDRPVILLERKLAEPQPIPCQLRLLVAGIGREEFLIIPRSDRIQLMATSVVIKDLTP